MELNRYNKVWLTSDTHYFHKNVIIYTARPYISVEQMNDALIDNFNSLVGKDDLVYHLGDFGFGNIEKLKGIREALNGTIVLIKGNHDGSIAKMASVGFDEVHKELSLSFIGTNLLLRHHPLKEDSVDNLIVLHGHTHKRHINKIDRTRRQTHYDVGVDANFYKPVNLLNILHEIG